MLFMLSSRCGSQQRLIGLTKERECISWRVCDLKPELSCIVLLLTVANIKGFFHSSSGLLKKYEKLGLRDCYFIQSGAIIEHLCARC